MKLNTIKNIKLLSFILVFLTIIAISSMTFADDVNWSNWSEITSSFGTTYINSVATNGTTWVAVGDEGKLATATDPTGTWTQRTSSFGTSNILSVATDGNIWVTVGVGGKLATATDPTGTWTQRTSSFGTSNIYSVAYGNGVWVAVGTGGKLATATDPTGTWTQRTSSFSTNNIWSVAYGNKVWIAVGNNGKLATATDPTGTWTQRTSSFETSAINSVAYGNGVWVTVGDEGKLATATDPTGTWTQRTSSFYNEEFEYSTVIKTIAYGNGVWVAAGDEGKLATATDPTGTWTQRISPFEYSIQSVATDGTNWIIAGVIGQLAYLSTIIETVTPSFATGTYNNNLSVTLTTDQNSSTGIYYTTDGSTPNNTNTLYTGAITISGTTTLKAVSYNGTNYSEIMTETYTMVVSDPVITQTTGTYNNSFTTTITSGTTGANIYYTTDGSTPDNTDNLYSGAITINATQTLKAIAYKTGYTTSGIDTETYTMEVFGTPTADQNAGVYYAPITIALTKEGTTTGTTLTYTTDGTDPTIASTEYTTPITIVINNDQNTTLKFAEFKTSYAPSAIQTLEFDIRDANLHIYFYDENTGLILDGNVSIVDLTNNQTYYANENGLFTRYLKDIDWKEKQINAYVERKVNGITTHTSRNLQFYWKNQDYDLRFALLPVGLGENIEFLVKDTNNKLWDNKYVQFQIDEVHSIWNLQTSSFETSNILSVATDGNIWVAAGLDGKLATATDPTGTWTQRTSSFGTSYINSVAYGNGIWVAVGGSGKLATATDPTGTWTQRTSSFGIDHINSVAYGNGIWVAVGGSGKLATATDPTGTWTQRTSSFSSYIFSVAYGNGVWVAVGQHGKLATATDPTGTWTQRTSSFETSYINSIAYGNGIWVAAGIEGKLATATDPTGTWTQRTSSFEANSVIETIAYGNEIWVAVGQNGKLATATDPTGTWTRRTSSFGTSHIWSVAYGNGVWVAVGYDGILTTAVINKIGLLYSSSKTSSTGNFSDYLLTDGNYNAVLYDATGNKQVGSNLLKRTITLTFSEDVNAIILNSPILFTNTSNIEIISSTLINYENYRFRFNQDPSNNQYYQFFEFIGSTSLTEDRNFQVYDINFNDETELANYCYLEINVKEMHMSVENAVVELYLIDKNTGEYKLYGERLTNQYGTTYFYIPKTENPKFIVNKTGFEEFVWLENPITLNCANSEPIVINLKSETTKPIFDYTSFWITKNEMNSFWGNNFWTLVTNKDENACFIYDPKNQYTITDNIKFNFKIAEANDTDELKMEIYLNDVLLKTEFELIQITSINTITKNDNYVIKTYINDELYNEYCVVHKDSEDYPKLGNEEVNDPEEIGNTIKTFRNDKSMGFFLVLIIFILASIIGILTGKGMFAFLILIIISLSLHNAFVWAGIVGIITIFGLIMKQGVNK